VRRSRLKEKVDRRTDRRTDGRRTNCDGNSSSQKVKNKNQASQWHYHDLLISRS